MGNTVPSLFLIQAWFPAEDVFFGTNGPSWSLAAELLFYLSFPWLARWVRAIPERRLWLCAGLLFAGTVLVALASPTAAHRSGHAVLPDLLVPVLVRLLPAGHPAAGVRARHRDGPDRH